MEIEVKNVIFKTVRDLILTRTPEKWISVSTEIYENLDKLNPTICEDGDIGKIAFGPSECRMKIRTARFLTRKLHLNSGFLNDVEIRTIQTQIDDILFGNMLQIYIATGPDITKNYSDNIGGGSCMTRGNANCTKLYENNPDTYSQLIIKRGSDSARAMVVKLDNGKYMLDRIYTDAEDLIEKMKNYADDQGWIVGYNRDLSESGLLAMDFIVTGLRYIEGEVPYQDTLQYGRIRGGLLELMYDSGHDFDFSVGNTNGYINEGYICCSCDEYVSEDNYYCHDGEIYCGYCFDQSYFYCNCCNDSTANDDARYIQDEGVNVCRFCADNQYGYCDECNEYYSTENVQYIESTEHTVCDDCLDNCYTECTDCHEFFRKDNMIELEAGDIVCEDCREIELQKDIADCIGQLLLPFKDQKCLPSGSYIYANGVEVLSA